MKYEKPQVEVILFDNDNIFMAVSGIIDSYAAALKSECTGVSGDAKKFTCGKFGSYGPNPPQDARVTVGDGSVYVFNYNGNHWQCFQVKKN